MIFTKIKKFWIDKVLKRTYVLNKRSGEVHDSQNHTKQCGKIKKENKQFISYKTFRKLKGTLLNEKLINGCRWCMQKYDLG